MQNHLGENGQRGWVKLTILKIESLPIPCRRSSYVSWLVESQGLVPCCGRHHRGCWAGKFAKSSPTTNNKSCELNAYSLSTLPFKSPHHIFKSYHQRVFITSTCHRFSSFQPSRSPLACETTLFFQKSRAPFTQHLTRPTPLSFLLLSSSSKSFRSFRYQHIP